MRAQTPGHVTPGQMSSGQMSPGRMSLRQTLRVDEPTAFGDVALAPAFMTGQSEANLARAMTQALAEINPGTASQALTYLRSMFPETPLPLRVAVLNALMRR